MKELLQKRIFKDAFLYSITNVVVQASSLLGVLFVSRYLGPTNLGLYSFVQNYIAAFVTILSGIDIYAHWHIVQAKNQYSEMVLYTKQKAVLTSIVIVVFVALSYFTLPSDIFALSLLLIIPLCTSIFSAYIFVLQYQNKTKLITTAMMASAILILGLKLLAVVCSLSLSYFVAINSLDGILLAILCVLALSNSKPEYTKQKLQLSGFRTLLTVSFFPIIYICSWFVVTRVDQFFVPLYFNAYTLGTYSAAVKVIEMTNVLIVIMQSLIIPRVLSLQDPARDSKRTHLSVYIYGGLGVATSGLITIFAPLITHILFGLEYTDTIAILRVYAWSIPGLFVNYLFVVIALSKKSYKLLAGVSISLAVVATTLSWYAAESGNVLLVASVSVLVYTISACTLYITWRKGIL
jgi:O-antigen/teichoic acid export membrane protein